MSAMREAFTKLGIKAQRPPRAEPKHAPPATDFKSMTGTQIEFFIRDLEADVRRITTDLDEDMTDGTSSERGEAWRAAATHARAKRQAQIAAAKGEIERRRAAMPDAERERRRAAVAAALQEQQAPRRRGSGGSESGGGSRGGRAAQSRGGSGGSGGRGEGGGGRGRGSAAHTQSGEGARHVG